jgi:carboxypeptidase PM20D1
MRKLLAAALVLVIAIVALVLVRAWLHRPLAAVAVEPVRVEIDEARAAQHLSEAVRFRTVSNQRREEFDAAEFERFIVWLAEAYPDVHARLELTRHGDYSLLYRWPGSDAALAPVLLTAHYDVVPVIEGTESDWRHPPFDGVIDDGVIWGRGALDDKSAVIAQLEAATYLLTSGFAPRRTVYFSYGHDEEVGGMQGAAAVTEALRAQRVQLAWSLDEGSFLFDRLLPGVDRPMASINVAEKGGLTLEIVAKADGGHSSMPPRQTAVGRLAEAISKLEDNPIPGGLSDLSEQTFDTASRYMPFTYRVLFANRWLFGGVIEDRLSSLPFGNAMLRTTIAPTMLQASPKVNVLPIEAIATVNFRVHPRDSIESITAHVKNVVESEFVTVRPADGGGRAASEVSDSQSPGFDDIARSVREIYGDVVVTPGLMIAGSDSRHYGQIADDAYRFNPMTVSQDDLTGFHGTNEKIAIANLAQGVRTYVQIIRNGAGD